MLTVVIPRPLALRLLSGSEVPLRRSGVLPGELPEPVESEADEDFQDLKEDSGEEDDATEHNGGGDNGLKALVSSTATVPFTTASTAAVSAFA